jgi:hypothetical protein
MTNYVIESQRNFVVPRRCLSEDEAGVVWVFEK